MKIDSKPQDRHKFWGKSFVEKDLETTELGITEYCKKFDPEKWRGYYNDIWKWSKTDKDFEVKYKAYLNRIGAHSSGGRPPLDDGDAR